MNLVIDLGNTQSKLALFEVNKIKRISYVDKKDLSIKLLEKHFSGCKSGIISSVISLDNRLLNWTKRNSILELNYKTSIPINNLYSSPKTLGNDRLANVVASNSEFPNENVLSVDFGTCIKYDFINSEGSYQGGAISPGLEMRYRSLNEFTDQLPLLSGNIDTPLLGNDTNSSIRSGVEHGIIKEVEGIINDYHARFSNLLVIFTGGNHEHFVQAFKNTIFARPNLTLFGLNRILEFNG